MVDYNPRLWMDHCLIDQVLLQHGCETPDNAHLIWTCTFEWERQVFPRRPVIAESSYPHFFIRSPTDLL